MQLRKYNVAATVLFPLIGRGLSDLKTGATFAAGDVKIIKDEGASANTTNLPTDEGNGVYSLALTATEMQAARIVVTVVDQTAPKAFEDQLLLVETYGNASAQHEFDLDLAALTVAAIQAGLATAAALATVQADTDDMQARLPAALIGGRMDASVGAVAANAITAAAIATGAVDADAIAADAINEIADGVLSRPISNVEPTGTFRTLYGAICSLVNRRRINAGNLEVYGTDDATVKGTLAVTTDAAQDPIKELDTA